MSTLEYQPAQPAPLPARVLELTAAGPHPARVAPDNPTPARLQIARDGAKRLIDFVGAAAGLLLLGPIMAGLVLLIRLEGAGPVLFRQTRLGRGGQPFPVLKFRTMAVDAEARLLELEAHNESQGSVLFKMKCDPRVTQVGRLLQRTSLDELPQLFNVLAGQMSLVGPRPLQIRDCDRMRDYDGEGFARRLSVRPGLTGLWQVSGRSDVGHERMLRLDLTYIDERSLSKDLAIILKTVWIVLSCNGAY